MNRLRRAAVRVPAVRGEEARAVFVAVFPGGFEEVDDGAELELAAYTDDAGEELLRAAFGSVSTEAVEDGWEDRWRSFHRPVRIGELWIGPPWLDADPGSLPVVIDPGRAFGTGAHASTRLALALLAGLPRGSVLDVGCGSGVLSIAAARLGFGPIVSVDLDPLAVEATRSNARRNAVALDVRLADGLVADLPAAHTVVSNIALGPVLTLAPRVRATQLVTAGYLTGDEPRPEGWRPVERRTEGEWAADLFARLKP